MAENNRRHRQVAHAIRDEIVMILRKDLSDPRLENAGMITVSGVDLADDLRNATVWVSFMGKEAKAPEVKKGLEALQSSANYMHRLLIKRISMKVHPKLIFKFDPMFDRAAVVSTAFKEAEQLEKETVSVRSTQEPQELSEESEDQKIHSKDESEES